jgi:sulfur relay (sulfurtransferase) DsrC/TusE family protein
MLKNLTLFILGLAALSTEARAEFGIIDHEIESSTPPSISFIVLESSLGEVRQYSAASSEIENDPNNLQRRFSLGGIIPIAPDKTKLNYCFFWADSQSNFNSSEIASLTTNELKDSLKSTEKLENELAELKNTIQEKRLNLVTLKDEFQALFNTSPNSLLIKEIQKLKQEKKLVSNEIERLKNYTENLERLLEKGRAGEESPNIETLHKNLSSHLKEAAQVTAVAERLSARRKQSAKIALEQKIKAVKEMQNEDPRLLAKEIIALRKKRNELENKLGTKRIETSDEF